MPFHPHVTVAALIQRQGRYLLVEEGDPANPVFNQPAGHIEAGETPVEACIREVLEETGWQARPEHLIGIYLLNLQHKEKIYYRFGFKAEALEQITEQLDSDIIACHWLTLAEITQLQQQGRLRSDLVMQLIEDDLKGRQFPLDLIRN
ncbi:NUDIX hydrolase [Nitrincola iocasae]|jgi:8-oxo-dGTP pyrophosphatase MutT (NUDIX family)|uniref:Phosphatase NudJ n=1 Tax=Nitrincola iocasae TaxID=2614693 RepID=A0A5J6LHW7_9GAMM|nr:NUDIX hydrolase [Nitrincola iocasae]QEW07973.1 NUDIX hydrolase [Nitrincola iocasae]